MEIYKYNCTHCYEPTGFVNIGALEALLYMMSPYHISKGHPELDESRPHPRTLFNKDPLHYHRSVYVQVFQGVSCLQAFLSLVSPMRAIYPDQHTHLDTVILITQYY